MQFPIPPLLIPVARWTGFELVIGFIEHLYTQPVTASIIIIISSIIIIIIIIGGVGLSP
jgi:hypothetical protein